MRARILHDLCVKGEGLFFVVEAVAKSLLLWSAVGCALRETVWKLP